MKNNETISDINQAMEKARANLYKVIDIYGRDSNEAVLASQKLDAVIVAVYKGQLKSNNK